MTATHAYLIASSAHTTGLKSTMWLSDIVVHNPGATSATATLFFLASGKDNSATSGTAVTVAAGASLKLADVVGATFGQTTKASGAILVSSDAELVVTSRTFNDDAAGTYGQYIEGYPTLSAIGTGEQARLIQLTKNTEFRTNIGFANATGANLAVTVDLYDADGTSIGSKSYTVKPWSYFQETDIIGDLTSEDVDDAFAVVSSQTSGAAYFTYASVTDNRTGDPIQAVPVAVTSSAPLYLLGAAHVSGYGGSNWRTDLELHNPGSTQASYTIELLKRVTSNTSPTAKSYTLAPGTSVRYDDVLSSVFAYSGAASLRITPTQGSIAATQRTYNDQPDGTYGQFNPGLLAGSAVAYGQTGRLVQLSQSSSDDTGFRSNLGLVNATGSSLTVDIDLYSGDGTALGSTTKTLGAYGYQQIDKVFTVYGGQAVADGYVVVSTATRGGSFFAYASLVDNRSGDPITVPAQTFSDGGTEGDVTIMLPGGVALTLVRIPAGTYQMGSPSAERGRGSDETQRQVTLTKDYYIGKYEVTQAQWVAVMGSNRAHNYGVGEDYPIYYVSWDDVCGGSTGADCAQSSFIGMLNQYMGTTGFRLPTEAEWEHAARAGTTGAFSFTAPADWDTACGSFTAADPYMWWCGNNTSQTTKPVGSRQPNLWGLFDMHGNVFEWVADRYGDYPSSAETDPTGPATGSARGHRGGSWNYDAHYCRSASRGWYAQGSYYPYVGFRLAGSADQQGCLFALSQANRSHGAGAEFGSIPVAAPSGCAWTAVSNSAWINVTSGAGGSGDGTVGYAVEANGTASQRTGTITVAGLTFTVTQSGLSCTYAISPSSRSHESSSASGTVAVTAASGCVWSAVSNAAWITVTYGASGTGNGTVGYSTSANGTTSQRTGTITVAGETFTVVQSGIGCTYTITPSSRSHGASSASGTVSVTATETCAWTAGSNAAWIIVTSGTAGSGNGTVGYSVAANGTESGRTGTITVAGKTFTITQAGPPSESEITVTLPGGVPLTLVRISAGNFQMGSPSSERSRDSGETQHGVTLTEDYYIGKYEVTQAQWQAVMGTPMPTSCGNRGEGENYPVFCVTWNDVCGGTTGADCASSSFIGKANQVLATTKFRLPTEAEWEYAARAGTTGEFSFAVPAAWDTACGSFTEAENYMWWCGNNSPEGTKPVGSKQANPWGLYDMHGNVWEWVADWYAEYPSSAVTDPTGPSSGAYRLYRGGSWYHYASYCRSAFRSYISPGYTDYTMGFRLARSQ